MSIIDIQNVAKTFSSPAGTFRALSGVNLQVSRGEAVAIVGKSGSGKSTLLNMIAGLDRPTEGRVFVGSTPVHQLNEDQLAAWRGRNVGIVFQFFQLLPTLTVAENVMLPMDFADACPARERLPRALRLLENVGIAEHADKFPAALSGGEQQRAAIARALANDPPIIVADEPTGNLDSHTAASVLEQFRQLSGEGKTVILVSHEREISDWVDRVIKLADGAVVEAVYA